MNITELARKLKITPKELRQKLPELGFDIGMRAIKVDDQIVQKVMETWESTKLQKDYEDTKKREEESTKVRKEYESTKRREEEEREKEKIIAIPSFITIHDFAEKLNLSVVKVISELIKNGVMATINERIDYEIAAIVAEELGFKTSLQQTQGLEEEKKTREKIEELIERKDKSKLVLRPPVVVVMGHVDHGKTKILDAIRETNVVAGEAGGITQYIGAYQVKIKNKKLKIKNKEEEEIKNKKLKIKNEESNVKCQMSNVKDQMSDVKCREITFIDTPGHETFKAMRARGGGVADIAVLVVAADDGVKPQTLESIKIIQEEKLPFLVAINKIDKPEADLEKVKKGLAEINLIPEDWGGKTICVPVSAKTKKGLDDLLEMILLLADLEKERFLSNLDQGAVGTVIEARLDKGEGPVATVLISAGTLRPKDLVAVGGFYGGIEGKIKLLRDFQGKIIKEAKPGMPARILGLKKVPKVGDILQSVKNLKDLKKEIKKSKTIPLILETKARIISSEEEKKALNIIIRTDVLGSQEAICQALEKIEHPEVGINIIKKGLGNILEGDILQAEAISRQGEKIWIIGFGINASSQVLILAKEKNVEIKIYKIIYELIDELKKGLKELLEPEKIRVDLAELEVIALFRKEPGYQIVGAKIKQGRVLKGTLVEIWRENKNVAPTLKPAKISQLQIAKKDIKEAKEGLEVGLKIEGQRLDIQMGDILKVYREEERERELE